MFARVGLYRVKTMCDLFVWCVLRIWFIPGVENTDAVSVYVTAAFAAAKGSFTYYVINFWNITHPPP